MKFFTKLWKRSQKSFATTIPHVVLFKLDESKEHEVVWEFDSNSGKWTVDFKEIEKKVKKK
ncbi:hypothetical protein KY330_03405 [Candidatus Woesearchaeota archaeon]|nr:hypothetical protein [Candidatus Woesearchaeota archaeon]